MGKLNYLRYDADSVKNYLIEKLTEDDTFKDQIFEGSNLSILISVFAWCFDSLTHELNHAASESMFENTQLFENIIKLIKVTGYNPLGFETSQVAVTLSGGDLSTNNLYTIPKFTTYTTDKTDTNGDVVKYTFVDDYNFYTDLSGNISSEFSPILYNGEWILHDKIFRTAGIPNETFTLDIDLSSDDKSFLSHSNIEVYVLDTEENTVEQYQSTTHLFDNSAIDKVFELRLNANKQYELIFGDNIHGATISEGASLYVIYLNSNGKEGEIGSNDINTETTLNESNIVVDGLEYTFIKNNILKKEGESFSYLEDITINNTEASTTVRDIETVEDIKENAPNWTRTGNRLITDSDFRQHILANYTSIHDCIVYNNFEYMSTFYQWLMDNNAFNSDIRFRGYKFADACDFNNIYFWLKSNSNDINTTLTIKRVIERDLNNLKPTTSELIPIDSINTYFSPYISGSYSIGTFDSNNENTIYLLKDNNTLVSSNRIKANAVKIIQDFFILANNNLGQNVEINELYTSLMSIDGVKKIRTRYLSNGASDSEATFFDGLSFAVWTSDIVNGNDLQTIHGNIKLLDFQFPVLFNNNSIANKIIVSSDSFKQNTVEY